MVGVDGIVVVAQQQQPVVAVGDAVVVQRPQPLWGSFEWKESVVGAHLTTGEEGFKQIETKFPRTYEVLVAVTTFHPPAMKKHPAAAAVQVPWIRNELGPWNFVAVADEVGTVADAFAGDVAFGDSEMRR